MLKVEANKKALEEISNKVQLLSREDMMLDYFTRLGAQVLRWVDQNMRTSGGLVGGWRPLAPLTIFGKRAGHGVPLETLRQTFTSQPEQNEVVVGTARASSRWHEFGTKGPYKILPRFKKALAFPAPMGFLAAGKTGSFMRKRGKGMPKVGMAGKGDMQSFAVVRGVMHPGLPVRRMLPNAEEAAPVIQAVGKAWFRFITSQGAAVMQDIEGTSGSGPDEEFS